MSKTNQNSIKKNPDWKTVDARVRWLVKTQFRDNRTAMAKAIGFSHTMVANVVNGRTPGRFFLDAIVTQLSVNPDWLNNGVGQPFVNRGEDGPLGGIPVTNVLLPGPPLNNQKLIMDDWVLVTEVLASPSMYWLVLKSTQPIVREPTAGFRTGDYLLMETDPAKFPRDKDLRDDLCVVRDKDVLRFARVTYSSASIENGDARLNAEFYDEPVRSSKVTEHIYQHFPNGEVKHEERSWIQSRLLGCEPMPPNIRYVDVVSVWLKLLRRQ